MANWFNISCKKATYLISKKQESKLYIGESVQLFIHLFICDVCKLFKVQTNYILKNIHQHHENHQLTDAAKQAIANKVNEAIQTAE